MSDNGHTANGELKRARTRRRNWKAVFLEALAQTANLSASAKIAGVDRKTVYRERQESQAFEDACMGAIDDAIDRLESLAWECAEGRDEPVVRKGEIIGTIRRPDPEMIRFLLRAHRPTTYRDNVLLEARPLGAAAITPQQMLEEAKQRRLELLPPSRRDADTG
jgi:hypothetical protein